MQAAKSTPRLSKEDPNHEMHAGYLQVYSADECFLTGTFSGLIPVRQVSRVSHPRLNALGVHIYI
jgi:branched-subunit amino acid aminotransferase/4-amino-4-deoxychorismate lyase